jgi:hypothetical protein
MLRTVVLLLAVGATAIAAETIRTEAAGLRFAVPADWTRVPAGSDVRAAQFRIPRVGDDTEDGELVLFFFGSARGGGVEDNVNRWYGQFTEPDGRSSRDAAVVTTRTVHGLKLTIVDLAGTYTGMGPDAHAKPDQRMLAAVIDGKGGPWFLKAIGPRATIGAARSAFDAILDSVEPHG